MLDIFDYPPQITIDTDLGKLTFFVAKPDSSTELLPMDYYYMSVLYNNIPYYVDFTANQRAGLTLETFFHYTALKLVKHIKYRLGMHDYQYFE